jgi:hypothetical protein
VAIIHPGEFVVTGKIPQRLIFALLVLLVPVLGAQAATVYVATLSGPNESPPVDSPGTGTATVIYDSDARTLKVMAEFSGLLAGVTAAHIHCCTADPLAGTVGVATTTPTFPGFPAGVTSGSYDQTFDLSSASSFNVSFLNSNGGTDEGAEAALAAGLAAGKAYFNIHTSLYTGGEIRGFLTPVPVPAAAWLFGSGLLGLVGLARRKKK